MLFIVLGDQEVILIINIVKSVDNEFHKEVCSPVNNSHKARPVRKKDNLELTHS